MASKFQQAENTLISKDPLDYINTKHLDSDENYLRKLEKVSKNELQKLILSLNVKKSSGYDGISNAMIKRTCDVIVPHLLTLYNACLMQGTFPNIFKIAKVIPLFKGGDRDNVNNYRPISLLPALAKLFEKLISLRILDYLDQHDVLSPHQFGFRKKFGTEYAITDMVEKLLSNMDSKWHTCSIFLDLAKAFDSVSHDILLKKLHKNGIRDEALLLLTSYLDSRIQFTALNQTLSTNIFIKYGVPQGSILGPLLFLLYINDLPEASAFYIKLFADDTFLCLQNSDLSKLEIDVNVELRKVCEWLASNKLTLNVSKSKYMITSANRRITPNLNIYINEELMEECDSYKYLGVMIDKNLTWKEHIQYVCKKVSKSCGYLAKLRHCVSTDTLISIYYALVHSYVRYGISSWGCATDTALQPLISLTNRIVRIITFAPFGNIDVDSIYKYLDILNVPDTVLLETGKFVYKRENELLPVTEIANHFDLRNENVHHHYNLRNRNIFTPNIVVSSTSGERSIQYRGAKLWNNLSDDIRQCESLSIFKKKLKVYLLEDSSLDDSGFLLLIFNQNYLQPHLVRTKV